MIFKRPYNITFVQMAQWVDANSYSSDRDDNKLVEYLYHITYIKSEKCGFFTDRSQYEDFALFCVSKFLIRFANKKEPPVKSVINYLKTVIDPWHSEYVREFCYGSAENTIADFNVNDFADYLVDAASENDYQSYDSNCHHASQIIRAYLSKIPIKRHSPEWCNICISCLLTLEDRLHTAAELSKHIPQQDNVSLHRIVRQLKTRSPVLFHVEEERSQYVSVLVNEIIHALSVQLTHMIHSKVSVTTCLQNLVKAANNDEDDD